MPRPLGVLLGFGVATLAALAGLVAVRSLQRPAAPQVDPRHYQCADPDALAALGRPPTAAERKTALARGVRLPWSGPGSVPRSSARRGNGVVRHGNSDDNVLAGTDGDDFFRGVEGDDRMKGGPGNDIYVFALGDGRDVIEDDQGRNILMFMASVDLDAVTAERRAGTLVVRYGPHETVTIDRYPGLGAWTLESSCGGEALPIEAVIGRRVS